MRRLFFILFLIVYNCSFAQTPFPKNRFEDNGKTMSDAYWDIWNAEVQAKIDADIDSNRKAEARIGLNNIPKSSEVSVEQVTHDFIFGAHIFNFNQLGSHDKNEKYKNLYGTIFNSATIAFYWKTFETEPERLRFATEYWDTEDFWNNCPDPKNMPHWRRPSTDQVVEFCESKGIRLHGHPMIWGNRYFQHPRWIIEKKMIPHEKELIDTYVSETLHPKLNLKHEKYSDLYKSMSPEQLSDSLPEYTKTINVLFEKRILDLAKRYGERIDSWDVVNESSTDYERMDPGGRLIKSDYGIMPADYTFKAFQTAMKVLPDYVKLNINDYKLNQNYLNQVNDLTSRGCKIDIVGAQMHIYNPETCIRIAEGDTIQTPDQIWKWTKLLSKTGRPIHLSEITIPSPENSPRGRMIQAVIARNLYRIWFSLKPAMGITWWNVLDGYGQQDDPGVSGLFDSEMTPKESFYALDSLINHEWKTKFSFKRGDNEELVFRGFKGNYKITWTDRAGNVISKEFYLKNDGDGITL